MNNDPFALLNAVSVILGLQNLQENREQSAHNDVQLANDRQAEFLLKELHKEFSDIKRLLNQIIKQMEENDAKRTK